jgi:ribosomal-protein-alanine N-acetyltransferase
MDVMAVGPEAAPLLAAMHETAFPPADRWGAQAIGLMLDLPGHFALLADAAGQPAGFAMGRVAADQAEVLTIAVMPGSRRLGVGRALMRALAEHAARDGAVELFLEVATANEAARALYAALGAQVAGHRRAYYPDGGDALVLRLSLRGAAEGG